jgi:hypothetical protein
MDTIASPATDSAESQSIVLDVPRNGTTAKAESSQAASTTVNEPGEVKAPKTETVAETKAARDERIDKYYIEVGRRQALEAEVTRLRAEQTVKPTVTPTVATPNPDAKPTWDAEKYKEGGYDAYVEELADWKLEQKLKARDTKAAETSQQTEAGKVMSTFQSRAKEANLPDFDAITSTAPGFKSESAGILYGTILRSKYGPQITYHLAKNPGEISRIDALPLDEQLMEIGDLAKQFKGTTPTTTTVQSPQLTHGATTAPAPIEPLRTGTTQAKEKSVDKMIDEGDFRGVADKLGIKVQRGRFSRN